MEKWIEDICLNILQLLRETNYIKMFIRGKTIGVFDIKWK